MCVLILHDVELFSVCMPYFCSCQICKIINGNGRWLVITKKKNFKKHQKKERESVEKINEPDTESELEKKSNSESISSCNAAEKRKFDDELNKSDISSESSLS